MEALPAVVRVGWARALKIFDSASLEEEQAMAGSVPAGSVLAGTGLIEGWQKTVWKGSITWKPRGDLALRDPRPSRTPG